LPMPLIRFAAQKEGAGRYATATRLLSPIGPFGFGYANIVSGEPGHQMAVLRERVRVLAAGLGLDESCEVPAEVKSNPVTRSARSSRFANAPRVV
jgi:hypothetical protein